jgi:hypothetical protein
VETMPFGYSRKIFKYPAVQYIPLERYDEVSGNYTKSSDLARINIYTYQEQEELERRLGYLGYNDNYNIKQGQLGILIRNARVNLIQYRGFEVIMVGNPAPGTYQVFKINTAYFYKDKLIFTLYDGETGTRLDLYPLQERVRNL